jgi:hypothetical protein
LLSRERFLQPLDTKEHALQEVLSDYSFDRMLPCGLKGCRRQHNTGFLVLTVDGLETNVGHVCGRKAFPEFEIKRRSYERLRDRQNLLDRAAAIVRQEADIRAGVRQVETARYGVLWIQDVRAELRRLLGDLYESLQTTERRQEYVVTEARKRSAAEIDRIYEQENGRRPRSALTYESTPVGDLRPMPWLVYNFQHQIREKLLDKLGPFTTLRHIALPTPQLKRKVRDFDNWERALREAEEIASSAIGFFEERNLQLLTLWVPEHRTKTRTAMLDWINSSRPAQLLRGRPRADAD